MVVDFPAPFGPRNPVMRPGASRKVRSSTAGTARYRLVSASTAMVLMTAPLKMMRWTLSTLGSAAAPRHRPSGRTSVCGCGVRPGIYAAGVYPGQPPGAISPDS